MATYKTYDVSLPFSCDEEALEYASGLVWAECETSVQTIGHARHIETIDNVGVYYDFAADYYFFTDESEEAE